MSEKGSQEAERRKAPRYQVEQGSFAIFQGDVAVLPGLIVDISKNGLAFFYLEGENWPASMDKKYYLFGENFHVDDITVEMVDDIEVDPDSHPLCETLARRSSGPCSVRRRGLRFCDLSEKQQEKLNAFIEKFRDTLSAA